MSAPLLLVWIATLAILMYSIWWFSRVQMSAAWRISALALAVIFATVSAAWVVQDWEKGLPALALATAAPLLFVAVELSGRQRDQLRVAQILRDLPDSERAELDAYWLFGRLLRKRGRQCRGKGGSST